MRSTERGAEKRLYSLLEEGEFPGLRLEKLGKQPLHGKEDKNRISYLLVSGLRISFFDTLERKAQSTLV